MTFKASYLEEVLVISQVSMALSLTIFSRFVIFSHLCALQYLDKSYVRLLLSPRVGPLSQSANPKMRTCSGPSAEEVQTSVSAPNLSSDYTRNAALSSPAM